ncbi:ABC transporter permease [Maribacter algicola]|uniref:ABC transporter permease n=1 Tax=Maribacter algicola TaxID=2498892 RepID=A0A3R8R7Q1_9FLAO|nr:ABC transporter permease [Maribacter algicola]
MIRHNLKLIIRNLWANKIYTSIILLSLVVAFVCCNILISFLVYETNTDKFHSKQDRIFQVFSNDPFGESGRIPYIPKFLYGYLTNNYPEIADVSQIGNLDKASIEVEKTIFNDLNILLADESFFSVFDFPIGQGNKSGGLSPGNIVLTQEKAAILFGDSEAVGKSVSLITPDTIQQMTVSAIAKKSNSNSHLSFDALVHHSNFENRWNGGPSYALMTSNSSTEALQSKIKADNIRPGLLGPGKMDYFFEPLSNSYFTAENKMKYMKTRNPTFLKVGYIVCGLILFIASFNFINLFLLFWQDRRKEMGIKKTLGITQKGLFYFSIAEAGFYIITSFLLSLIITLLTIPVFNSVFEANLSPEYLLNIEVASYIGLVILFSAALVVTFSVSKQWRMKPVNLMKNESSKVTFSGFLFTFQFIISITLTICSISIIEQMNYIENAPLGFNRNIIQLDTPDPKYSKVLPVLKQKIAQLPNVKGVTVSGGNPISGNRMVRYELENEKYYTPFLFGGDKDFIETLNLNLIEGSLPSAVRNGKLVNQKLIRQFDLSNPIGKKVPGTEDLIVGVVEDFTCGSFKEEIPPVIIAYYEDGPLLLIDYQGTNLGLLLPEIETKWKELFPDYFFSYKILEEELMKKYKEDTFFYNIIVTFAIISMILASFGLFALSWAVTQSRSKEMGIRKVLGASTRDIVNLLTYAFSKRILLAFIIAIPMGYYLMNQWLTRFANRIDLSIWIFILSGLIVILISVLTLSMQTIKATRKNPIEEISTE